MDLDVELAVIMIEQSTYDEMRQIAMRHQRDVAEEIAIALAKYIDRQ